MHRYRLTILLMTIAALPIGYAWAQQAAPPATDHAETATGYEPLFTLEKNSSTPFTVNQAVAAELVKADDELAAESLDSIKQQITELVTRYPNSPATEEAKEILDKAGLKVIPGFGIYSKDVICLTIPITR